MDRPPSRRGTDADPYRLRELEVVDVRRETADAVSLVLRELDGAPLRFAAGQFLTFTVEREGARCAAPYSLSTSPLDGPAAAVTVKRVPGGRVSGWLVDGAKPGMRLAARGPSGLFVAPEASGPRHHVLIAGGSGITPVISLAETLLRTRPADRVSVLYGNRRASDVIFAGRLAALVDAHPERAQVVHVLEEPDPVLDALSGRLDRAGVGACLDRVSSDLPRVHYLCGPLAMMDEARAVLTARGVPSDAILEERFQSPAEEVDPSLPGEPLPVTIEVAGRAHEVTVAPGQTVLDASLRAGVDLPFSCTLGGCGACRVRQTGGALHLDAPNCLTDAERASGVTLTCVARPLDSAVRLRVEPS